MTDGPLPFDEENELYGYGVLNVHLNSLVPRHGTPRRANAHVRGSEEEAIEHFREITDGVGSSSHLRVVEVRLVNEADRKAAEVNRQ